MNEANMRARAERLLLGDPLNEVPGIWPAATYADHSYPAYSREQMLTFATTIAEEARADERERCARIAETRHERWSMSHPDDAEHGEVCCDVTACRDIAAAIRSTTPESK